MIERRTLTRAALAAAAALALAGTAQAQAQFQPKASCRPAATPTAVISRIGICFRRVATTDARPNRSAASTAGMLASTDMPELWGDAS